MTILGEGPDSQSGDAEDRYVAFVDVLGFSDLVLKSSHEQLLNIYRGTLQMAAEYGISGGSMKGDEGEEGTPDTDLATVNMRIISDSVLMWTDGDTSPEFVALVMATSRLLAGGIAAGTPLRAAITWGPVTHERFSYNSPRLGGESLVGRALVEAYQAEQRQQWSGGYVSQSAMDQWQRTSGYGAPTPQQMQDARWLYPYEIPMTDGSTKHLWAINWTRHLQGLTEGLIRQSFSEWGKSVPPHVEPKVQNTVAFAEHLADV